MATAHQHDIESIEATISCLFEAISWDVDTPPDWQAFRKPFHPDARLFPSARPAKSKSLEEFIAMMDSQYPEQMRSFSETALQTTVHVFGNVATAIGSYSSVVNGGEPVRGVNVFGFIRDTGAWKVASMCWDGESEENPIPDVL